ncbi:hypothetical protein FQZ97_958940 [compost metagenome]
MATDTSIEVSVRLDHAGYKTATVHGKRASCTYDPQIAVKNLAAKLYPGYHTTVERLPFTPVNCIHSKWRITPGEVLHAAAE